MALTNFMEGKISTNVFATAFFWLVDGVNPNRRRANIAVSLTIRFNWLFVKQWLLFFSLATNK